MIAMLKKWKGRFEIDGQIYDKLDDVIDLKDGDNFDIFLLKNRRKNNENNKEED